MKKPVGSGWMTQTCNRTCREISYSSMLKQYARRKERSGKTAKARRDGIRYLALVMNWHECGSVATSKRPPLNGVLDFKTVYMERPSGVWKERLAPDTVIPVRSEPTV
jgi:hypothetical protein